MDYSSLLATVAARMNRSDLATFIPTFIVSVESEANTFLAGNPVRPMIKTYTLTATDRRLELPTDFIDVVELTASDGTNSWPLARIGPASSFDWYDERALAPGVGYDAERVQQYRIVGDTLVLSAAPSTPLSLVLDCTTKLEPVNEGNATNWLMDAHPDVYEFGTLAHAAKHVRDLDYYEANRDLFISALGAVPTAYPEKAREMGLRSVDGPWSAATWDNVCG